MKAAITEGFGGVERLVVREMGRPAPGSGELLVRVRAASMNPLDCKMQSGHARGKIVVRP